MVDICVSEMSKKGHRLYTLEEILQDVCDAMGITVKEIKNRRRFRKLSIPRQIYGYVAKIHTNKSYNDISNVVGYNDHTTVIKNNKKVLHSLKHKDPVFMEYWDKYIEKSIIYKHVF